MAKEKERELAYNYYINQGLTAKAISTKLDVSEKTVGDWIDKGNWKKLRLAKQTGYDSLLNTYNELQEELVNKRLAIERGESKEDKKGIIDEISKISASMDRLRKQNKPTLRMHIWSLERIFTDLQNEEPEMFFKLISFQKNHLSKMAEELK